MKKIALTFDDGPNTTVTPLILDLFKQYGIKASFFVVGEKINEETIPVMKRCLTQGCEIENHSFSHPALPSLPVNERVRQVEDTTGLIEKNLGTCVKYFRPPYIAMDAETAELIRYPLICGIGCDDWDENVSVDTRVEEVLKNAEDGQIVLLHDSDYNFKTVEALKTIIPKLLDEGYEFVTVEELFEASEAKPEIGTGRLYSVVK